MLICGIRLEQGLPESWSTSHIVNAKNARRLSGTWQNTAFAKKMQKAKRKHNKFDLNKYLKIKRQRDIKTTSKNFFKKSTTKK